MTTTSGPLGQQLREKLALSTAEPLPDPRAVGWLEAHHDALVEYFEREHQAKLLEQTAGIAALAELVSMVAEHDLLCMLEAPPEMLQAFSSWQARVAQPAPLAFSEAQALARLLRMLCMRFYDLVDDYTARIPRVLDNDVSAANLKLAPIERQPALLHGFSQRAYADYGKAKYLVGAARAAAQQALTVWASLPRAVFELRGALLTASCWSQAGSRFVVLMSLHRAASLLTENAWDALMELEHMASNANDAATAIAAHVACRPAAKHTPLPTADTSKAAPGSGVFAGVVATLAAGLAAVHTEGPLVNPATGLSMVEGTGRDVAGNAFGTIDATSLAAPLPAVNPATGLPMIEGTALDVGLNTFGADDHWEAPSSMPDTYLTGSSDLGGGFGGGFGGGADGMG